MSDIRSSDSMSRCGDQYDNMFQVNRRPDLKATPITKDTIEVSRTTELKKEAIERLTSPRFHLLQMGFMKAGKILFLTIVLPPYFVLWGLPKIVISEGATGVMILVDWLTEKMKQKAQKPMEFFINRTNWVMFQAKLLVKRIIKPVVQLGIEVRQFFHRMRETILAHVNQWQERIKNATQLPRKLLSRLNTNVKNRLLTVKEAIQERTETIKEKMQEGLNRIKEMPLALIAWGTAQLQKTNFFRLSIVQQTASKFQMSVDAAKACHQWISTQFGKCKKLAQIFTLPFVRLYQEGIKPALLAVANVFKNGWSKTGKFIKDRRQKALRLLEEVRGRMKQFNAKEFLDWVLTSSKMKTMPHFLRKILLRIQQNWFYRILFGVGYWLVTSMIFYVSTALKAVIEFVTKAYEWVARGCQVAFAGLKNVFAVVFGYIGVAFESMSRLASRGLYAFLLAVMMTGILIHWGFQLAGELSSRAASKLSFSTK